MPHRRRTAAALATTLATAAAAAALLGGCGGAQAPASHGYRPAVSGPATIRVPEDAPGIQEAVDSARPGDLVLVGPGTYRESVRISTPRIVLRGTDRNRVIVDGEYRRYNGVTVSAAGVAVENLTVRAHRLNGVLFTGITDERLQDRIGGGADGYDRLDPAAFPALRGFRVSYVTSYDNALYGIYAFDARDGLIEHTYTSGQADSGLYVGQCRPCNTLVVHNVAESNAVGYEQTNASGSLVVAGNRFTRNRVGLTSNSDDLEALAPQRGSVIAANDVSDNDNPATPEQADGGFGIGIGIGGGTENTVTRNRIHGNRLAGVLVSDSEEYPPAGNEIRGNDVTGNGTDLALRIAGSTAGATGNCFAGNAHTTSTPARIESALACGRSAAAPPSVTALVSVAAPPGISFRTVPPPAAQPSMPGSPTATARPAVGLPPRVDVSTMDPP
ncbi:MAG: hypothetical protein QOI74_1654 [Micromonosporaceae bacterium]|nr:hypothetical protein [Micromonosporaceae bacterium]